MAQQPKRVAGRMAPHPKPAPDSSPPVPTTKRRGRSDTLKAAWIGALAGSVVAAALTGTTTWVTAQGQIQAENELSSTEFLRQEQKAAYATWLAADAKVSQSAHDLARTVKTAVGSGRPVDRQDVLTTARAEMDGLIVASSALYLVGSPATIETVRRSAKAHIDRHDAIFSLLAMRKLGPGDALQREQAAMREIYDCRDEFIGKVRQELGAEVSPGELPRRPPRSEARATSW
jgi:hypothetical protein